MKTTLILLLFVATASAQKIDFIENEGESILKLPEKKDELK